MSNIVQQTKRTTTDQEGNEVVEEKEQVIRFPKTADFVMAFTKDLGYMRELTRGEMLTMFGLLQIVNRNNEIILNMEIKKRIAEEYGLKVSSFDVFLSGLKKKNVIVQNGRGCYLLQPNLFGKGNWTDIKKLRMAIEWDFENKTKRMALEADYLTEEEKIEKEIEALQKRRKELDNPKE